MRGLVSPNHEHHNLPQQPLPPAPAVRAGGRPARRPSRNWSRASNDGLAFQTLLGVTGSGKTFTMANVIAQLGRPAMVMAPNKTLAAQLYSEMREFFPGKRGRVFRLLLRLLPARGLRAVARPVHREGFQHQRAHRADAPVGDQVAAGARGLRDRRHRVGDLRHRRPGGLPRHDPAPAPGREDAPARRHQAPDRDAVRAQRDRISRAALSACAAT